MTAEATEIFVDVDDDTIDIRVPAGDVLFTIPDAFGDEVGFELPFPTSGEAVPGPPGKSAYELAVDNGFSGSLEQWLNSLKAQGWHFGSGPPGTIVGSRPGDRYLDEDTGIVYALGY